MTSENKIDSLRERLGRVVFEISKHLDPGISELATWDELIDSDREFWRLLADTVLSGKLPTVRHQRCYKACALATETARAVMGQDWEKRLAAQAMFKDAKHGAVLNEDGSITPARPVSLDKQEIPRTDALRSKAGVSSMHYMLDEVLASHDQLERELAEEKARVEQMMDAEQERLLLASEDEIRKEILADGRDPDEYLKAMDTVMKVTGENAILRHDLQKALANHSADLSARGDNPAADFAAQLAARRSYEALHWAATWVEESGHYNEAVRSFAKNMAMTIRAEADSRCEYVGKKK